MRVMDVFFTMILVVSLLFSVAIGSWARRWLRDRTLESEAIDSVRVLMGMLLTFAAIVLGLLTSNAKQRFDGLNDILTVYAADLIQLDERLRFYGPDAAPVRTALRAYTAAAIASSWPREAPPAGDYQRLTLGADRTGIESRQLGALLETVDLGVERLVPEDALHRKLASRLSDQTAGLLQQRWKLIFAARSTIAWPFLLTLTMWLCIIFAVFGMTAPPGRVISVVVVLSALSIASPLYLILDYSDALNGSIELSSAPMRSALAYMDSG